MFKVNNAAGILKPVCRKYAVRILAIGRLQDLDTLEVSANVVGGSGHFHQDTTRWGNARAIFTLFNQRFTSIRPRHYT
jgi:hypothetical protein